MQTCILTVLHVRVILGTNRQKWTGYSAHMHLRGSHRVYTRREQHGSTWQNTIEPTIISDAVYNGCSATRQIPGGKSLVIFMKYWQRLHDLQQSLCRVQCRQCGAAQCDRCRENDLYKYIVQYTKHRISCDVTIADAHIAISMQRAALLWINL